MISETTPGPTSYPERHDVRELDPEWRDLIQRALDDRADPWERVYQPAEPETVERTLAFVDSVVRRAT